MDELRLTGAFPAYYLASQSSFSNPTDVSSLLDGKTVSEVEHTQNALESLSEYWKIKGMFLSAKSDPNFADANDFYHHLAVYLDRHSTLPSLPYSFWNGMTQEEKEELCRHICMVDHRPLQLVVNTNRSCAELCIIFNGSPMVMDNGGPGRNLERVCRKGSVVGPMHLFNNPALIEEISLELVSSSIYSDKGSVLRIPFSAYFKHIHKVRMSKIKKIVPVNNPDVDFLTEEELSVMSEDDMEVFRLRKLGRQLIPSKIFAAMLTHDLIGSRDGDRGSQYISSMEYGKVLPLSDTDGNLSGLGMVYIVLSGSLQLRLSTSQHQVGKQVTLLGKFKSDDTLDVQAQDVPVIQLEAGSWLTVNKDILTVGQQTIVSSSIQRSRPVSGSGSGDGSQANTGDAALAASSSLKLGSSTMGSTAKGKRNLARALQAAAELERQRLEAKRAENMKRAYRLYFKIVHPCVYLAIPYAMFVKMMKEVKSQEALKQINAKLHTSKVSVLERIEELMPLIKDMVTIEGKALRSKSTLHDGDIENFKLSQSRFVYAPTKELLVDGDARRRLLGAFMEPTDEEDLEYQTDEQLMKSTYDALNESTMVLTAYTDDLETARAAMAEAKEEA